jgi:hypothetical protein
MLYSFTPLGLDEGGLNISHDADVVEDAIIAHVLWELLQEIQNTFFSGHDNNLSILEFRDIPRGARNLFAKDGLPNLPKAGCGGGPGASSDSTAPKIVDLFRQNSDRFRQVANCRA